MQLIEIQKEITLQRNRAHIGKIMTVLIEPYPDAKNANQTPGRTDGNQLVILPLGAYKGGELVQVRILEASPHALKGIPV